MSVISLSLVLSSLIGTNAFKENGQKAAPLTKPYSQQFEDRYSPLKLMGGLGPYSCRTGLGISTDIPAGCEVDQVVLLQRHGERYPDKSYVTAHRQTLAKIRKQHLHAFTGDLEFLNDWEYLVKSDGDIALELTTGPYSGLADLYQKGSAFKGRYGHLWDGKSQIPLFAGGSERIIQSARAFGEGLFGNNYTDVAQVNFILETPSSGANAISPDYCADQEITECPFENIASLTSSDGPTNWLDVWVAIRRNAYKELIFPPFDVAAIRLNEEYGLSLTAADVTNLLEIGAFDLAAKGQTPWLDVFTREEWTAYNYREGLFFHCFYGGASKHARTYGTNWANATTEVLNQGPEGSKLPLVLNFCHDTDITAFLAGMEILKPLRPLRLDQIVFDTRYDVSEIIPMGAQLVIERLKCSAPGLTNRTNLVGKNDTIPESYLNQTHGHPTHNDTFAYFSPSISNDSYPYGFNLTEGTTDGAKTEESMFVRLLLNDAVLPLDDCYDGPGYSCSLEKWTEYVAQQTKKYNYQEVCKPAEAGHPAFIDYYWNYNHTTANNTAKYIPWQGSSLM